MVLLLICKAREQNVKLSREEIFFSFLGELCWRTAMTYANHCISLAFLEWVANLSWSDSVVTDYHYRVAASTLSAVDTSLVSMILYVSAFV